MPKSLERLIELLPMPLLLAAAALFSLAWLVKELRPHPAYGPALRDKAFLRGSGTVFGGLVLFLISQSVVEHLHATNFTAGERGLCISLFQGDADAVVQRQTAEYLRSFFASDDALSTVRIALYPEIPTSHTAALELAQKHGAIATIWGTVIPGGGSTMVVFNVSVRDKKKETRKLCPQFPDIHDFTAAIGEFIKTTAPQSPVAGGEGDHSNFVVDQLRQLRADNEHLNGVVAQLQRAINATASVRAAVANSGTSASTASGTKRPKRYGLFIGIDNYPRMNVRYQFAAADARAMSAVFRSSRATVADDTITTLLLNEEATRASVAQAIDRIAQEVTPDDQVWLYFSGTGFQQAGRGYLGLSGASIANLTADSLAVTELEGRIRSLRAKKVLMLVDACHSGLVLHRGVASADILRDLADRDGGKVWLAAGSANELAFEEPTLSHGIFTFSVLDGLSGKADTNADGFVTASELSMYVADQVVVVSRLHGFGQRPWFTTLDGTPDFTVATVNSAESRPNSISPGGTGLSNR